MAAIVLAALAAYAPALNGEFLWDDSWLVQQNPFFKSPIFIFEVFRHYLFLEGTSTYYRPFQNISYMPDYWLWHSNPFGYHLSNILFHAVSGWLLFRLTVKLLPTLADAPGSGGQPGLLGRYRTGTAFVIALIWVVHPIHNAAIAYVAGRADSLASLFAIAAWLTYWNARNFKSRLARAGIFPLAMFLLLLALCSKEIAITWIVLFVFHAFAFDRGVRLRQKLAALAGIALVLGCYSLLRHQAAGTASGVLAAVAVPPWSARGILALRALGDYTGLIFFPSVLHMDRTVFQAGPYTSPAAWQGAIGFEYLSVFGAGMVALFAVLCWKNLPARRVRVFGAVWFFIGFLPISNLFPLNAQSAEHWIYMPSFGFLVFLAGCVSALPASARMAAVAISIAVVPAFIFRTAARARDWADPERFYLQTIYSGGGSARINLNLALVYSAHGDSLKAEKMLRRTLQIAPEYVPARLNLGINLLRQGRAKEAEEFLKFDQSETATMAKEQPHTWSAALNLAHIRHNAKQNAEAFAILDGAISLYPRNWDLVELKARILQETAGPAAAIPIVESYAQAHWWHFASQMTHGKLRAAAGDAEGAVHALHQAGALDIHAVAPFTEIARIRFGGKKFEAAREAQLRAIRRDPDQPSQYLFLSSICDQLGRPAEAAAALHAAEALRNTVRGDFKHLNK